MARLTIDEKIAAYETKLEAIKSKLDEILHLKELEEGGASGRFRTQFNSDSLNREKKEIESKLEVLYNWSELQ